MVKKTLRGKRHIRARANVRIGRDKKQVRKMKRGMWVLMGVIRQLPETMSKIVDVVVQIAHNTFSFLEERHENDL